MGSGSPDAGLPAQPYDADISIITKAMLAVFILMTILSSARNPIVTSRAILEPFREPSLVSRRTRDSRRTRYIAGY